MKNVRLRATLPALLKFDAKADTSRWDFRNPLKECSNCNAGAIAAQTSLEKR
jgi:hypothetical protein